MRDELLARYDFGGGACVVDIFVEREPVTREELRRVGFDWWARLEIEDPARAQRIMDRIEERRAKLALAKRRLELEELAKKERSQEER